MTAAAIDYAEWVLRPPIPEWRRPTRHSYFICSTPRSGSWLLCGLLASTGVAGRRHEWFWTGTEDANTRAWGASGLADYVRLVHEAGTTLNGVFGAKLMWAHAEHTLFRLRALGRVGSDQVVLARHFPNPRFVWSGATTSQPRPFRGRKRSRPVTGTTGISRTQMQLQGITANRST